MTWPVNKSDLNSTKNLRWKFKKMIHEKASFNKEDLFTAIKES